MNILLVALLAINSDAASTEATPDEDIFAILEEEKALTTNLGSATASTLEQATSSVWIIDRETILSNASATVGDLMMLVPGVTLLNTTNGSSYIEPRGYSRRYLITGLKWLVDYQNVMRPVEEAFYVSSLPVPLQDIERIEVLLGPASTLYGANAYSGVVNIVTKHAKIKGWRTSAQAQGGVEMNSRGGDTTSFGNPAPSVQVYSEYAHELGTGGVRAMLFGDFAEGSTLVADSPSEQAPGEPRRFVAGLIEVEGGKDGWQTRARVMTQIEQSKHWAEVPLLERNMQIQTGVFVDKNAALGDGDHFRLRVTSRLTMAQSLTIIPNIGTEQTRSDSGDLEAYLQYTLPTMHHHSLSFGAQASLFVAQADLDLRIIPGGQTSEVIGVFVEDAWQVLDNLRVVAGFRLETSEAPAFANAFSRVSPSPRIGVSWSPSKDHALRAEFSTAYRNPSVAEMFTLGNLNSGTLALVPNVELRPEQQLLGSIGYQGSFNTWLKARSEIFYGVRRGESSLEAVVPNQGLPAHFTAVGDSSYYGGNVHLAVEPSPTWSAFAYYSYVANRDTPNAFKGANLGAPQHSAGLGGRFKIGRLVASVNVFFQEGNIRSPTFSPDGRTQVAHHLIVNPFVGYFFDEARQWQVYVAATNVTDTRFGNRIQRDFPEYQTERIGPRVFAGLRMNLGQ